MPGAVPAEGQARRATHSRPMAKRRLTRQQQDRIRQRQQQEVDERLSKDSDQPLEGPRLTGVVACHFGQQLEVEALEGPRSGALYRCFQRSNLPPLVCGDRVVFVASSADDAAEPTGVIVALDARRSEFRRPGFGGQLKPVAANIDLVLVVLAPRPQPFLNLLDRYLVAVIRLGLDPLIVINKADLLPQENDPVIDTVMRDYPGLGYPVVSVSAHDGNGLSRLKAVLAGKTAVIVGQSGVGKSSLVNALDAGLSTPVGELSGDAFKGTHTTTAARLFHLDGFDLIDSPGIREFALWPLSAEELLDSFLEFRPHLGHCRFRDCSHRNEPGCALRDAVAAGSIPAYRLESYFQILDSLATG